jgi:chromate transporter
MVEDSRTLVALVLVFAPLSLFSIGGGPATLAEMQYQAVTVHAWVTQREFADLFAISRAAPGPGALLSPMIGWRAGGWLGALTVSFAFFFPSSVLVCVAGHYWSRWRGVGWHAAVEEGFVPITGGLVLAGALAVLQSGGAMGWGIALAVAAFRLWRPKVHPFLLLGVGALVSLLYGWIS